MPSSNDTTSRDLGRTSYSKDEVLDMYALGRMWLETGQTKKAEAVMHGLNSVAPDFAPAWLGTSLIQATLGNFETAHAAAQRALKLQSDSAEAMMFVVSAALALHDMSTAGTFLGEVGDMIDARRVVDPNVIRVFKMQLARYQGMAK